MSGDCVCRFLCRDGGCLAEEGYLCPTEHDVEGLLSDIEKIMVANLNNKLSDFCTVSQIGELVIAYKGRERDH